MTTHVLIHGAGDSGASWDLVAKELRNRGDDVVAPDLPCDDESAGLAEYTAAVTEAVGRRNDVVVVAHSLGGFTAPLVCDRLPAGLLVLVAAMVPAPGERATDWWGNTGLAEAAREDRRRVGHDGSETAVYLHDVPDDVAAWAMEKERDQAEAPMLEPWPLEAWPDVPTRYLLCTEDRFFPAEWTRRMVEERLGVRPDEIESGHCPYLSRPAELAERLQRYAADT